ncbi:MAG: pyridoxamine 5'-phosphate oxidase family protein [Nitrospirae bacterium]|nr:pyridoxamine 5'-phosphate oxidase family protein [Nitrospirota bacterium]MBF0534240.1 pyridoxamine 5'-phosphate oxidase family protein [Nitrospirota bacterium]MBF0615846.1 pyridoxamine 5'-phosphate oxidase family protein [Nitrospirota bacterium]
MGTQYKSLKTEDIDFIKEQRVFFVASSSGKEVNLSPKGYESLKIIDSNTLLYMDYPGSGDRTARDIRNNGQVTLMFTSFTETAKILRLFCQGELIERNTEGFLEAAGNFREASPAAIRRFIIYRIYAVETSCGKSVPYMQYSGERAGVRDWALKKSLDNTIEKYIKDHATPPEL